jgi:Pretoxin HINT domain
MCFEAGTEVATDKGLKAIEYIKAGDRVLSYNEQSGALEYQFVTQTFTRLADDVWQLKVEGEAKPLGVTSEHPFYVRRKHHRTYSGTVAQWQSTGRRRLCRRMFQWRWFTQVSPAER